MQKRIIFTLLLGIVSLLAVQAETTLSYLSTAEFKTKVCYYDLQTQPTWNYLGDKPCLIDFSTSWCGWCKKLHPVLEEVANTYKGQIYVYTLDAEREPEIAALFGVRSYPTVILCPMQGTPQIVQGFREKAFWDDVIRTVLLPN